jgi:SAM-dependent methyltransferase
MPTGPNSPSQRLERALIYLTGLLRHRDESARAAAYSARLRRYHVTNDAAQHAWERSRWVAETAVPMTRAASILEVGANSGRTLQVVRQCHPEMRLKGIDVNRRAIAAARRRGICAEWEVADLNHWTEPADGWDAIVSLSVLNWMPDAAAERLAGHVARSARHVIAIELWDGTNGPRGLYKYSRDTKALFTRHGFETLVWEPSPGQYDVIHSPLWAYVGRRGSSPPTDRV